KRRGIPLEIAGSARAGLDASEIGPVIHVVTPRAKHRSTAEEVSVRPWGRAVYSQSHGTLPQRVLRAAQVFGGNVFGRDIDDQRERLSDDERRELETWEVFEALTTLTRTFNRDAAQLTASGRPDLAGQSVDALFALAPPSPIDPGAARKTAMERAPRWC